MDFTHLAQKYGTPLYVYDFDFFGKQFSVLKRAFNGIDNLIAYAVKANSNLSVIKKFAELDSGADCVSIGEIKRAVLAGIKNEKIIFSGVGKSEQEILYSIENNILMINVESKAELAKVSQVAESLNKKAKISIRVNPNIDPKTHPHISTGLRKNKFGVDLKTAIEMYKFAKENNFIEPIGIHFHIGSQLLDIRPIKEAVKIVFEVVQLLKKDGVNIEYFDVGGGIGISYGNEKTIDVYDYANFITSTIKDHNVKLILEPGRFLTANGGWLLTRVLYEKQNGNKRFVIVDAAMNDLIRPVLYNAYHRIEVLNRTGKESRADVVGPICESGDFFAKSILLPQTTPGDIIAIHSVGAYGFSMASNYNSRLRAMEIAIENGKDRIIRNRETFNELIKDELDHL